MSQAPAALPRPVTPHGLVASRLADLVHRAEADPVIVDPQFAADLRRVWKLAEGLEPYLSDCTTPESAALRQLAERTRTADWTRRPADVTYLEPEMLSGHVEGQALKFLVHATRARRVLDIGMFTGYSALAMAEALPDDGEVVACEIDAEVARFAELAFMQSVHGTKITVRVGPALETLHTLARVDDTFDLVFVDADKTAYAAYLDALLRTGLLASHALICVDNTLMQGEPWAGEQSANGAAIAAFNRAVTEDRRVEQVLLPVRDGLTLIRRAGP